MADAPLVHIQFEHPPEMYEWAGDQLQALDNEIAQWEERLMRLRICRDAIANARATIGEMTQQPVPGGYPR